jgi:hypothetical protein
LKQNPGDCLAIVTQALRWHLEPYWVAQHSYVAKAEGLISYDAAVHAAIVLSSGLLRERPRYLFTGEGDDRRCTVSATFKGEATALDYTTPPLGRCRPPKNERGEVRGSPLWIKDPDQQLGYYAVRNWGRRHCPEVLGGVYDRDEFDDTTQDPAEQVMPPSPNLMERLPGKMQGTGFTPNVVDTGLAKKPVTVRQDQARVEGAVQGRQDAPTLAAGAAKAEGAAQVAAESVQPAGEAPSPVQPPTNEAGYMVFAARWIEQTTDPEDIKARWEGESEMRITLKVGPGVRKRLEGMIKSRIAELQR